MTNSVLLIGGAGYIGPIVAEHLLSLGNNVRVLDNLTYQNGFSLDGLLGRQGFDFIQGDMGIPSDVERAAKGISSVILLAGLVGDPITKKYPEAAHQVNDISISSCLETLSTCDIDRLVFISTCSNYGIVPENQLDDEETSFALCEIKSRGGTCGAVAGPIWKIKCLHLEICNSFWNFSSNALRLDG
jgi:nucleoside-diphosphate-sugar epimerase